MVRVHLQWQDPHTGQSQRRDCTLPLVFGRDAGTLPTQMNGQAVTQQLLVHGQVSRFHALIQVENGAVQLQDQNSRNGTWVNDVQQRACGLQDGDRIRIGPYEFLVTWVSNQPVAAVPAGGAAPESIIQLPEPISPEPAPAFPPPLFQSRQLGVQDLYATRLPVTECDYLTIGAGLGSFVWVDCLRLSGVQAGQICALGLEDQPYARYKRLCLNSQIPLHERLRSNSDSCPDNIWGWPSYALREAWAELQQGHLDQVGRLLWQVFSEPTGAETYTPRAGNVFRSIDREAARIGWANIYQFGRVRALRQTQDGRYAVAYSLGRGRHALMIARYVHIATGYPAIQFLPDLQDYRVTTRDFKSVVNAYEDHGHVYEFLEKNGGIVLLRGRGIVASRIIQRLYEARQRNDRISILHLMRSQKNRGATYSNAQRPVENHFEFQPFNWPKACWGGPLRDYLEQATPEQRATLIDQWGGTTTADRQDWRHIVQQGLSQGWYQIAFGSVSRVEMDAQHRPLTYIHHKDGLGEMKLTADFIIDATGLDGKVNADPFLADLVHHYNLPLNPKQRLSVTNQFELLELRNQQGRVFAAGAITFGGPYAAVDSFLGLQYVALQILEALTQIRGTGLQPLTGWRSLQQWMRWVHNQTP